MMLYKYLPGSRIDVLQACSIRFTQPRALNDPFEGAPLVDMSEELEGLLAKIDKDAEEFWEGLNPSDKSTEKRKELDQTIIDLKRHAYEVVSPDTAGIELMDRLNSALGILSLSRTPMSLLMWSHYADGHRGMTIGFDDSNEFFRQRSYAGFSTVPRAVSYTSQRSTTNLRDPDYYQKLLCEKPVEWAYEEEVRIFRTLGPGTSSIRDAAGHEVHLLSFSHECVKQVFLGAQATDGLRESLYRIVSSWHNPPEIETLRMSKSLYALEVDAGSS